MLFSPSWGGGSIDSYLWFNGRVYPQQFFLTNIEILIKMAIPYEMERLVLCNYLERREISKGKASREIAEWIAVEARAVIKTAEKIMSIHLGMKLEGQF
jgi:hypothetical protein